MKSSFFGNWKIGWHGLTHWGRLTHICINNLTIFGTGNSLLRGWCQAIIWTNAEILSIKPQGTNFREILCEIHTFSFNKMHSKRTSAKWWPFCLGLNVLTHKLMEIHRCVYQHCGYCWPGTKAPDHQYLQWWLSVCIGPVLYKNGIFIHSEQI